MSNWNVVLSSTRNLNDVLIVLQKVLALLQNKADVTTIDEALDSLATLDQQAADSIREMTNRLNQFGNDADTATNEAIMRATVRGFATEQILKQWTPDFNGARAKADDTKKIWRWELTSAAGITPITGNWVDTGLSEKDQAINYTNTLVGTNPSSQRIVPLAVDSKGNIPVWLDNGLFDFADSLVLGKLSLSNIIPIAMDEVGNIPVWLQGGLLGCAGLTPETIDYLKSKINTISYKTNVFGQIRPIQTDGSSLRAWSAKAAKIQSSVTEQLKIILTGDSWTEHSVIATELKKLLVGAYGEAGSGWINMGAERNMLDGITITYSTGWTVNDMDNGAAAFPYGCAPDGFTRTSSTVGNTITLGNLTKGNELSVFFGNTSGVFSYQINSAAEVQVTADATGKVVIPLTTSSTVILKVVSGTICFFGMHLRQTTGSGVELNKLGNGNCTGRDYLKISPAAQSGFTSFFSPDVVVIILGTNDYRRGHSVADFKAGISAMIDGYRTGNPNCGIILVTPARSNVANPPIPLVNFTEAIFQLSQEKQAEVYNAFDDFDVFANENTNGQWSDNLHLSKSGAYRLSKQIFKKFLEL